MCLIRRYSQVRVRRSFRQKTQSRRDAAEVAPHEGRVREGLVSS